MRSFTEVPSLTMPVLLIANVMELLKNGIAVEYVTVTDDNMVEFAWEMWPRLLEYAQTFESRHPFYEISLPADKYVGQDKDVNSSVYSNDHKQDGKRNKWYEIMGNHPLEQAMFRAFRASHEDDMQTFKMERRNAVAILEPQYKRMVKVWSLLHDFIQQYPSNRHTFFEQYPEDIYAARGPAGWKPEDQFWTYLERNEDNGPEHAIALVELCVLAFNRDMPVENWVATRVHSRRLNEDKNDRYSKIESLNHAYDQQNVAALRFIFKALVDELEEEFHRVRDARKALTEFDILRQSKLGRVGLYEKRIRRIDWEATGWNTVCPDVVLFNDVW
jgi:hypothetical protein